MRIFSFLFVLAFSSFCSAQSPLKVVSYSPSGRTADSSAYDAIQVTFNQPVVPLSSPDDMGKVCPVSVEPPAAGRCRWQGTQVLRYEFNQPLRKASEYSVTIPKILNQRSIPQLWKKVFPGSLRL
jgi:hypothetical protein